MVGWDIADARRRSSLLRAGSVSSRPDIRPCRDSGTGSGPRASPGPDVMSARAISRAKRGFPEDARSIRTSCRRGNTVSEPLPDELMERPQTERADVVSREPALEERAIEADGSVVAILGANGGEDTDRYRLEPPDGELEHPGGRAIQPLHVVDGEKDRARSGEMSNDREEPCRDRTMLETAAPGLSPEKSHLESAPLRARDL
jgi:hypothetical protein